MNDSSMTTKVAAKPSAKIPPRNLVVGFSTAELPRYYHFDNPFASAVMIMLSAAIPKGERFFVESVRHFRDQITDADLNAQVSGFISQEAFPAKEHDGFNLLLLAQGFKMAQQERVPGLLIKALRGCPKRFQFAAALAYGALHRLLFRVSICRATRACCKGLTLLVREQWAGGSRGRPGGDATTFGRDARCARGHALDWRMQQLFHRARRPSLAMAVDNRPVPHRDGGSACR